MSITSLHLLHFFFPVPKFNFLLWKKTQCSSCCKRVRSNRGAIDFMVESHLNGMHRTWRYDVHLLFHVLITVSCIGCQPDASICDVQCELAWLGPVGGSSRARVSKSCYLNRRGELFCKMCRSTCTILIIEATLTHTGFMLRTTSTSGRSISGVEFMKEYFLGLFSLTEI